MECLNVSFFNMCIEFNLTVYSVIQGKKCMMIATDVYRPVAIDQLVTLGKQVLLLSHPCSSYFLAYYTWQTNPSLPYIFLPISHETMLPHTLLYFSCRWMFMYLRLEARLNQQRLQDKG